MRKRGTLKPFVRFLVSPCYPEYVRFPIAAQRKEYTIGANTHAIDIALSLESLYPWDLPKILQNLLHDKENGFSFLGRKCPEEFFNRVHVGFS